MNKPLSPLLKFCFAGCCALLALMTTSSWAQSALTAQVDRTQVSVEETLTLQVRYSGQAQAGAPDFSQLEQNFDIISQQRSNQFRNFNGNISAFTEWTLLIAPRRTGQLLIPSFEYNGHFSDAIQIEVTEAQAVPGELKDIFLETEVDQSEAYVQQQVVLTYRLFTTRSIDSLDAEPLEIDGVRIEELPQARYQRRINGVTYGVLEVPYALFPQTSEPFTVPAMRWTLRVVTAPSRHGIGFGAGHYELRRLRTDEQQVLVQPRPESFPQQATWLPAEEVSLSQQWSQSPDEFRVGEPITRTIALQAQGLSAAQLPPLPIKQGSDGLRIYPDQPQQANDKSSSGITGTRTETMAIVPQQAGELTLPAVEVEWWDTEADALRTARLPEMRVQVQPGAQGNLSQQTPQPLGNEALPQESHAAQPPAAADDEPIVERPTTESRNWLWPLLAAIFALLWVIFMLLWLRSRRLKAAASTGVTTGAHQEKQAFRQLNHAAQTGDLTQLRHDLLNWGHSRWPDAPPVSLQELGRRIGDLEISQQLAGLDAAIYRSDNKGDFDPGKLIENLTTWRKLHTRKKVRSDKTQLKPLY